MEPKSFNVPATPPLQQHPLDELYVLCVPGSCSSSVGNAYSSDSEKDYNTSAQDRIEYRENSSQSSREVIMTIASLDKQLGWFSSCNSEVTARLSVNNLSCSLQSCSDFVIPLCYNSWWVKLALSSMTSSSMTSMFVRDAWPANTSIIVA